MPRYKLTLEYDGGPFVGWQRQENGPSIQAALEQAAFKYCGEQVTAAAAGRTDAGVHALGQVAHLDLARGDPAERVQAALNFHLKPDPVAVIDAVMVPDDFHARFSCREREYRYVIANRRAPLVLARERAWWVPVPLNEDDMHRAAQLLVGQHDFTSFRAIECQAASPVKTLEMLNVTREGDEIHIAARAQSFLHHQVRNIVGTLRLVGEGKWSDNDLIAALNARDRSAAGLTAPPDGLYFVAARY